MKAQPLGANNGSSSICIQRALETALEVEQKKVALLKKELEELRKNSTHLS